MSSAVTMRTMRPGYLLNYYPENRDPVKQRRARSVACQWRAKKMRREYRRLGAELAAAAQTMSTRRQGLRDERLVGLRMALAESGWTRANLVEALALVGAKVRDLKGFDLHPEQYFGAWVLLHGMLAEMATGEGKTIVAGVAAVVAGISGMPVHVITSNDYLVERDALSMRPLFEAFGLTSAHIGADSDDDVRRRAYACDVCYVSNKQLVFDYLRDRQSCGARPSQIAARIGTLSGRADRAPLLRGLCFGIVDEADSAFIDDAITPLILSHQTEAGDDMAQAVTALSLARRLTEEQHFSVNRQNKKVTLTPDGIDHLAQMSDGLHGKWTNQRFCNELARQALAAIHVFRRDVDYLVREGEVLLIDQATGRLMPDRKLQHGLHQIIEAKEQCELSGASRTIASLSFQNFFVRYKHLCGMTGTASEAAAELRLTYRQGVVQIPTHRPTRRLRVGARFARQESEYRELLVDAVRARVSGGQPVLIGTRSLAQSEKISEYLTRADLPHQVLNARQDASESDIVAQAGQAGAVTIATNMAGRGTDIPISDGVREHGGLHVVVSQFNESRRVDRQLIGRCSRQGDPGSFEFIIAPDDPLLRGRRESTPELSGMTATLAASKLGSDVLFRRARRAQKRLEWKQRVMRSQVANSDRHMRKKLSYTGYKE